MLYLQLLLMRLMVNVISIGEINWKLYLGCVDGLEFITKSQGDLSCVGSQLEPTPRVCYRSLLVCRLECLLVLWC